MVNGDAALVDETGWTAVSELEGRASRSRRQAPAASGRTAGADLTGGWLPVEALIKKS